MTETWRGLSRGWRVTIVLVGVVVVADLTISTAGALIGHDPSGPSSSSFATSDEGLAGLSRLYAGGGHPIDRLRTPLGKATLDPATTLVVADPDTLLEADVDAVDRFVRAGGRLLVGGPTSKPLVDRLVGSRIDWQQDGVTDAVVLAPAAETDGISRVRGDGNSSWLDTGSALPILGGGGRISAAVLDVGAGRVVALADTSPLQNRHLGEGDTATFALLAAGPGGRSVVFDEASHGYGAGGTSALPDRWVEALIIATAAVLALMWTAAARLGPPEDAVRELPPPRRGYVDALAVSLSRTGQPAEAVAELQRRGRGDLARRLGLDPDAQREQVLAAVRRAGYAEEDVPALFDPPRNAHDVMEAGRAAARQRAIGSPTTRRMT